MTTSMRSNFFSVSSSQTHASRSASKRNELVQTSNEFIKRNVLKDLSACLWDFNCLFNDSTGIVYMP